MRSIELPSHHVNNDLAQFRTPQLLMVSGIGPSATLGQLGIPVLVKSEGVGQGMWVREYTRQIQQLYFINFNRITHSTVSLTR